MNPPFNDNHDSAEQNLVQPEPSRLASAIAVGFTVLHLIAGSMALGWFYFIVPRVKQEFDDFGTQLSQGVILLIQLSDLVVNYWYIPVLAIPVLLVTDFTILRSVGKQASPILASLIGACLLVIPVAMILIGRAVLQSPAVVA